VSIICSAVNYLLKLNRLVTSLFISCGLVRANRSFGKNTCLPIWGVLSLTPGPATLTMRWFSHEKISLGYLHLSLNQVGPSVTCKECALSTGYAYAAYFLLKCEYLDWPRWYYLVIAQLALTQINKHKS